MSAEATKRERPGNGARLTRENLSVHVADYIRGCIFNGQLKADERIQQDAIAEVLGVSRVPVREALIALEAEGLVASAPHRGTHVVPIRQEDIEDHYRMYGMIQALAAVRAIDNITEPILDELQALHDQMCSSSDPERLHELNTEFHRLINHTGGSKRVRSVLRYLSKNLPSELYRLPPGASPQASVEHQRILDGLREGDATMVEMANRDHVRRESDYVVAALRAAGVLAD
ncbi:GntR family transcriptional regulator [Sciscionella sediminilitoris]|uniref:GntR family transcriptional regulator n=1 Tax=Sciscionella sediminilitoris TaxID=1445613 RepID=UPI001E576408|nr:GntR family transcriptional regulator [Sciscionella sp. SE31]